MLLWIEQIVFVCLDGSERVVDVKVLPDLGAVLRQQRQRGGVDLLRAVAVVDGVEMRQRREKVSQTLVEHFERPDEIGIVLLCDGEELRNLLAPFLQTAFEVAYKIVEVDFEW